MNDKPKWIRTARCEDIPLREGRSVRFGEREIAIFNLGDRFVAISNRCPHRDGPLSEGIVSGNTVVCPLHAWKVGLDTGDVERPADTLACVETFRVRVEAGFILVEMPLEGAEKKQAPGICIEHGGLPVVPKPPRMGIDDSDIRNIRA
ncbi:MAG: nitrite reductase small subunit NirD [Acidobacteriia bacterium]|nr:nitrite reductase small subunit NirD [Terriglobia bacterium]